MYSRHFAAPDRARRNSGTDFHRNLQNSDSEKDFHRSLPDSETDSHKDFHNFEVRFHKYLKNSEADPKENLPYPQTDHCMYPLYSAADLHIHLPHPAADHYMFLRNFLPDCHLHLQAFVHIPERLPSGTSQLQLGHLILFLLTYQADIRNLPSLSAHKHITALLFWVNRIFIPLCLFCFLLPEYV